MKKIIITSLAIIILGLTFLHTPVFAEGEACTCVTGDKGKKTVDTAILSGCDCSPEGPNAIQNILLLVLQIMSIGAGIFGVLGITIVGIQYLTAGGSEEKTRKAKRRLIEILIGLAVYAVMAALLNWLAIPTPKFDSSSSNTTAEPEKSKPDKSRPEYTKD